MADEQEMTLFEHLAELRTRLLHAIIALALCTLLSFAFAKPLLRLLLAPMGDNPPVALTPTEAIGTFMKVALIGGVTLAMPVIVYQVMRFVAPGLTPQEKRYLFVIVPGATICFVLGAAFAYFIMLPAAVPFLQNFLSDIIRQQWAIGKYISFVTDLIFWVGLSFETPLLIFFLAKLRIVSARVLWRNLRYAIIAIAILAALITPTTDPFNMALVMGPLIALYLIGVILAWVARRGGK
ncbi:MAG: twin-arginine translocase subunit TatC [Anaerolineae bacterium]|jgi:sec-independent protein translocase protein TatC|nr:twin-arginine translocase subunit TatC [Anaerolineae bacterium]MDH7473619.1 twin-arginine translocase subunit TatC [Anaerolineae bacterium]